MTASPPLLNGELWLLLLVLLLVDKDSVDGGVAMSVSSPLLLLLAVDGSLSRRGELKKKEGAAVGGG